MALYIQQQSNVLYHIVWYIHHSKQSYDCKANNTVQYFVYTIQLKGDYNVLFYKAHNQLYTLTVQRNDDELYKAFELILRSF